MTEKILATIITEFTKELISQTKDIFTDLVEESKHFIGTNLKKYLEKQKTKYAHIKTLLRGNTPVYLYEVYFQINLIDTTQRENIVFTDNISNVFKNSNYITIIGDAGSGKSTLTKHLFLNAIKEKYGIPILVELRYLNETDGDIQKFITEKIFENKLSENDSILQRLLLKGKFVFFLDGFDELSGSIKNKVIKNLNAFINCNDKNKYILTSRPYSNIENLPLFKNLYIKKLERESGEIDKFIELQLRKEKELAAKIIKSIKENNSLYIQSFLVNPLLLTLYILTFQTNAEIPNKKYIFYRRVINALFSEHDSKTKLGYIREKQSSLSQEQFEEILKAFCFLSFFDQAYNFDYDYIDKLLKIVKSKIPKLEFDNNKFVSDLISAIALWTDDNGQYSFAHRSLQEYFAALFIKNLNPIDNERVYKKIIKNFSEVKKVSEIENFLTLCQEMDRLNFTKFYYLPLLYELKEIFNKTDDKSLIEAFVKFFSKGLELYPSKNHPQIVHINDHVYRTIYIHLPYTRALYHELRKLADSDLIKAKSTPDEKRKNIRVFSFEQPIVPEVTELLQDNLITITKDFYSEILSKIKESEDLLISSSQTDKELIDLI